MRGWRSFDALGRVAHVVKIGSLHGRDDAFYEAHYRATFWAAAGMVHEHGLVADRERCIARACIRTGPEAAMTTSGLKRERGQLAPAPSHPPMKFQSPGRALRRGLAIVSAPEPASLAARRTD